jgi:hypothetical protein
MIRSARTMLDAMEELVEDPDAVATVVGSLSRVARDVVHLVEGAAGGGVGKDPVRGTEPDDDIEHIPVD